MQLGSDQPFATAGGHGFLRDHLQVSQDLLLRRNTAVVLWLSAWVTAAVQQFSPIGVHIDMTQWLLLTAANLGAPAIVLLSGRFFSPRGFLLSEHLLFTFAWVLIALNVAAAGGADSPYAMLWGYAFGAFFGSYFIVSGRALSAHGAMALISAFSPLVYDHHAAMTSGYLPMAVTTGSIYLLMGAVIFFRRRQARAGELQTRRLALTDPLTGVANLRAVEEFAGGLTGDGFRTYAVVMVDLDGLKSANTAYGHAGGDDLILRAARLLCESSEPGDQVARVGGDEFVVLIADAKPGCVDAWRQRFAEIVSAHNDGIRGVRPLVAASIGGATSGDDGNSLEQLMAVADARMYECKAAAPTVIHEVHTLETNGGRQVARTVERHSPFDWEAWVPSLEWLAAALLLVAATWLPGFDDQFRTGALLLAACCGAMVLWCAVGEAYFSAVSRKVSDGVVIASAMPGIYFTGGSKSPVIALVVMAASYFADFRDTEGAKKRIAVLIVAFSAGFWLRPGEIVPAQARFSLVLAAVGVIAFILNHNHRKIRESEARVRELSELDSLTHIPNRRVFEFGMNAAIARVREEIAAGAELTARPAVILADLDDFKCVNTALGHKGGDALLRTLAGVLRDVIADRGIVCRVGGDEFAVILNASDPRWVNQISEECRAAAEGIGRSLTDGHGHLDVSVSIGYALWREPFELRDLMTEADNAMRRAKQAGKNAVSAAEIAAVG